MDWYSTKNSTFALARFEVIKPITIFRHEKEIKRTQ